VQPGRLRSAFFIPERKITMAVKLPNGSIVAIASGYTPLIDVSAATNANPAVLTTDTQSYAAGDIAEVTSGWSRLNSRIVRLSAATSTSATLDGVDTTSTQAYPAGGGTGSIRTVSGWTQLAQIVGSTSEGGEQQFTTYQFLEADAEVRIPTNKSASGVTFTVADDPTLPGYVLAQTANEDRVPRAIRITFPDGSIFLMNAYISLAPMPSLNVNEIMTVQATLSLLAPPVRYAS
jgi:hypothetical protein